VSHNDDSIPTSAYTSVDDKAGVEGVDDMQSLDDSKDDEDVNEQVDVEDNEDKDCRVAVRLSVDLLYPCMFSVFVWTALLMLQCPLQHIRALQLLQALQSQSFRLLQCLHMLVQ